LRSKIRICFHRIRETEHSKTQLKISSPESTLGNRIEKSNQKKSNPGKQGKARILAESGLLLRGETSFPTSLHSQLTDCSSGVWRSNARGLDIVAKRAVMFRTVIVPGH
jgi:hypothetical protein